MTNRIKEQVLKFYCSFLFTGYSPLAPGTAGTLGAIVPYYFISDFKWVLYLSTILIFTYLSILITNLTIDYYDSNDPGEIVVDEVCGFLFTMILIPFSWTNVFIGFLLFRIFDIIKPYPIRKIEKLKDGYGIILDDVFAGIYSNIILHLTMKLL